MISFLAVDLFNDFEHKNEPEIETLGSERLRRGPPGGLALVNAHLVQVLRLCILQRNFGNVRTAIGRDLKSGAGFRMHGIKFPEQSIQAGEPSKKRR